MEIGAFEAKSRLANLLERVAKGEEITITKRGHPVAKLVPVVVPDSRARRVEAAQDILRLMQEADAPRATTAEIREWINTGRT